MGISSSFHQLLLFASLLFGEFVRELQSWSLWIPSCSGCSVVLWIISFRSQLNRPWVTAVSFHWLFEGQVSHCKKQNLTLFYTYKTENGSWSHHSAGLMVDISLTSATRISSCTHCTDNVSNDLCNIYILVRMADRLNEAAHCSTENVRQQTTLFSLHLQYHNLCITVQKEI